MARTSRSNFVQLMESGAFWYHETPVGTIDSSNTAFTLTAIPNPTTSLEVTLNGQELSVTKDYTLSNDDLTILIAPITGSIIKVDYRVEPA